MREKTKAYMAGLVDAEGCFSIGRVKRKGTVQFLPQVIVVMTHKATMNWIAENFGGTIKTTRYSNPNWNTSYRWVISNSEHARRFLSTVQPYLIVKKDEADVFVSYLNAQSRDDRETAYSGLAQLKKRSVTTDTLNLPKRTSLNAYLAGFFDGEGHIGISVTKQHDQSGIKYMPSISLANTFIPIVDVYKQTYGGFTLDRLGKQNTKNSRSWFLNGQKSREDFLLAVVPYLKVKREQAKLMLTFVRLAGERSPDLRNEIMLEVRRYNGRKIQSELTGDHESDLAEMPAS